MAPITLEYKRSAEYKEWVQAIKAEAPDLPEYLIDLAIAFHKSSPKAYKEYSRSAPPPATAEKHKEQWARYHTVEDAVKVYDPEQAPAVPHCPLASS